MTFANSGREFAKAAENHNQSDLVEENAFSLIQLDHAAFLEGNSSNPAIGFALGLFLGSVFWLALAGWWLLA